MASTLNLAGVSTKLLYSTARIVAQLSNNKQSIGTAFFFNFKLDNDRIIPVLVTNKHVVANSSSGTFLIHEATHDSQGNKIPSTTSITVEVNSFADRWIGHPGDVDVCAMPVAPLHQQLQASNRDLFYIPLEEALIPSDTAVGNLVALEDVIMVGYPIGLWDPINNYPLLRRGITATHPHIDFNGKPLGAVDIAAFPGSSGSPILILNQGSYSTPNGITIGSRIMLLGVLAAGPQFTAEGEIEIVDIPTANAPVVVTRIPIHLGYYIKSRELLVLKQHLVSQLHTK